MNPKRKEQSLKHDRRNTYGENDKSSRKSIHRRKQWVNQAYRRAVRQSFALPDPEMVEDRACTVQRVHWKKWPDQPLGNILRNDLIRKIKNVLCEAPADSPLLPRLEQRLTEDGWAPPAIRVVMRQLRSIANQSWSSELDLDLVTARRLIEALRKLSYEHWATFDVAARRQEQKRPGQNRKQKKMRRTPKSKA
jgi:hypothetical protein